jgi:glycosyltransferase involved in cell wall biosynthesis
MPLTAIEAAAMAKPVVATAVDGTVEVVSDGVTGRLVPCGDVEALATALQEALANPVQCRAWGRQGHERASAYFSSEAHASKTEEAYRLSPLLAARRALRLSA